MIDHKQGWEPIEAPVFFDRPEQKYTLLPVWTFSASYREPDGEVPTPSAYEGEDGVVDWELKHKTQGRTRQEATRKYYYFGARHLDPRFRLDYVGESPLAPRPVSDTYGDLEKDWEIVMEFRDRILQREGLSPTSPPEQLAYAFALEIYKNWRGGGTRNHPADVLTHRSWCLGAEITTGVILRSLGIPVRGARVSDHAMCEAWIDGAWRLLDSSNHFINHEPKSVCMLPTDYLHLTTDPTSTAHGDKISDYHRGFFYHFPQAHYGIPDGRWLEQSLLWMCPAHARALYPTHPQYRFKTADPQRLVILERDTKFLYRYDLGHNLRPGEQMRESVYLGEIDDAAGFEFEIRLAHIDGLFPTPDLCKDLVLHAGEMEIPIGKKGLWPLRPHHDRTALLTVPIPKEALSGNQVNWFRLENRSLGRLFRIPLCRGIVDPYIPPLLKP